MYRIEKRASGYILTFAGEMDKDEMYRWYNESKIALMGENSGSFGVIINMKDLIPLKQEAMEVMVEGQKLYKDKGMNRSAVILKSGDICRQFKNLAIQSGIYAKESYIDASAEDNPVDKAIKWVKDCVDPDRM